MASNQVLVSGLHGIDTLALGVLPWGDNPIEARELVPETLNEIAFDFPAILLPPSAEILLPSAASAASKNNNGNFNKNNNLHGANANAIYNANAEAEELAGELQKLKSNHKHIY